MVAAGSPNELIPGAIESQIPIVEPSPGPTDLPAGGKRFLIGTLGLAGALAVGSLMVLDATSAPWLRFAALAGACALAQLFAVRIGRNQSYHTAIAFLLAAALSLPPGLIVLVVLAQHIPDWVRARYSWYIQSFNIANYLLDALAAWALFRLAGHGQIGRDLDASLVALASVALFVALNHVLLATMLRLARGRSFRASGLFGRDALATDLILAGLGPALVALWDVDVLLVPAAAAPLVLVHRSLIVPELREEHERERELRAAEMRYRLLVEQLPLATYILAPDHTVLYISPQIESILGCTVEEAVEEEEFWTERLHPEDRERVPQIWRECVARGEAFRAEYRMLAVDGRTVWIQDEAVAAQEGDRTLYFQGYLLDISKRKQALEGLARVSQQNELLLRSVGEGIFGLDRDGRVISANPAAGELTGCPSEALLGLDLHRAIAHRGADGTPCTGPGCPFSATIADGIERHFEAEITRLRNGATYVADCTTTPLVEEGACIGAVVVVRDISEQRELEERLRQAQKLEAVGKLAGGIAHDFNNLLTAITGHSELALVRLQGDPVSEHVTEIKRAADRASALTQQLLAFSRKQVLQPRVLDVNAVVVDVESLLRRLIGEDISLQRRLDMSVAPVRADLSQLEQVLVNLAVNARDAMPAGGNLTIETSDVALDADSARSLQLASGAYLALTVSDTGHGMDAATCARVFEPFFTTKEQGKGTGLGLSTAYGIVAQSGGTISVESTPGSGTTFTVYLPAVEEETSEPSPPVPDTPARLPSSGTVLLVEDEDMVRELTEEMLRGAGINALTACDPDEALALYAAHPDLVDVLLTDVVMPGMSGHALADRIRAIRSDLEVIYTSGYSDEVIAARGRLDPSSVFLAKPYTRDELITTVQEALARKERVTCV
jgi:PAS domain S-box-containing protein